MHAHASLRVAAAAALAACLAAAGCATTSPGYSSTYGAPPPVSGTCYDCGTVTRIDVNGTTGSNVPNATGAVLGGIVGAVAGREIAKNNTDSTGRTNTATAAGAVAGAVVGNAIQNRAQANNGGYTIYVRMSNGSTQAVTQADLGGIREGSYVRVYNGRAWLN
ncbi:MAG: glycine zipper 2TM domain-containing protein [Luteimonas sp.]|jgi:outer membrane lipoprotein SlyB